MPTREFNAMRGLPADRSRGASRALFLYILVCFFPYPALPVGTSAGLQLGHMLGLAYLPFLISSILKRRNVVVLYLLLAVPSFISIFIGTHDDKNLNSAIFQAFGLLAIPIVGALLPRAGLRPVLAASSVAMVVHGLVGLWQQISYLGEEFPFAALYINPSFAIIDAETARLTYGVYTKRSFGLFPEPSAMFASLSCFLVLSIYMHEKLLRKKKLNALSNMMGLVLFYLSKSGGLIYFVLACIPYIKRKLKTQMRKKGLSKLIFLISVLAITISALWVFWTVFETRTQSELGQSDGSWTQRSASILFALQAPFNGTVTNLFLGYGLGDVSVLAEDATGYPAVHSWLIANFMASGLLGTLSFATALALVIGRIRKSAERKIGYACFFMWLTCVTFITGYFQLLPLWVFLGVLISWPEVFRKKGAS